MENFRNNVAVGIVVSYRPPVFDFELPAGGGQTQSTRTPHTFLVKSILQLEIIIFTVPRNPTGVGSWSFFFACWSAFSYRADLGPYTGEGKTQDPNLKTLELGYKCL